MAPHAAEPHLPLSSMSGGEVRDQSGTPRSVWKNQRLFYPNEQWFPCPVSWLGDRIGSLHACQQADVILLRLGGLNPSPPSATRSRPSGGYALRHIWPFTLWPSGRCLAGRGVPSV